MNTSTNDGIHDLYHKLINAWNNRDAHGMAELFSEDGVQIGFDGSKVIGREELLSHLKPIFKNHPTPPFISKVKNIRMLGSAAMLHAIVGMVPPGKTDIAPELNAHQTLVAVKKDDAWEIELFQNTPAQYHGRPDLVEQMTEELKDSFM
ncbi:SgcJ/EcaC family oxidoreductase [Tuberibacillus sp. Marseille-P3662]|uniref:SgcJ/EcaC family oxidoreductase n=1 Tax=Tuberibacillus sp. Marseille-P3662 TaxID=1965358 RepID=UPI000A1C7FF4|nr:SgcJ/EcaC family oxidoreductase [Tuberibacillus sp. Marseille-P3662]